MTKKGKKKARFVLDEVKLKAATALARGDKTDDQILPDLGISKRTLSRWKEHPDFQLKIAEIIADIDITMKAERIKIVKKEITRVLKKLELNEDKSTSRDLVALLKFVAEETAGEPVLRIKHEQSLSEKIKTYTELFEE
jgi:hypothetical protein